MLEIFLGDKIYTQRTPNSKIVEFDLNGIKLNTYDELPIEVKEIIKLNKNMELYPDDYFEYKIIDNSVTITKIKDCLDIKKYLRIPEQIKGYPVTRLQDAIQKNQKERLRQINLPNTLEELSFGCFSDCYALKYINIPNKIKTIPTDCFRRCWKLSQIDLNNVTKIEFGAFDDCRSLSKIDLTKITDLEERCFRSCSVLETVIMPEKIKIIPPEIFYACKNLKKINLSDSIKIISHAAFFCCESLEEINIPKNLKLIQDNAFQRSGIKIFNAPENLRTIGKGAFWNSKIEEINLNKKLNTIGSFAFLMCKQIKKINIFNNTTYEDDTFDFENKLKINIINEEKNNIQKER